MKRTTIMVDENTLLELSQIADERSVSASQVIREALAEYVVAARARRRRRGCSLRLSASVKDRPT